MTPDPDIQSTQPKPAEGARDGRPPAAEQGTATGRSSDASAEGSDEASPPTKGSPVG